MYKKNEQSSYKIYGNCKALWTGSVVVVCHKRRTKVDVAQRLLGCVQSGAWSVGPLPWQCHWTSTGGGLGQVVSLEPYHVGCRECYASAGVGEVWVQAAGFGPGMPRWTGDPPAVDARECGFVAHCCRALQQIGINPPRNRAPPGLFSEKVKNSVKSG